MNNKHVSAWYYGTRKEFLDATGDEIAGRLAGRAAKARFNIDPEQSKEWENSVDLLQKSLGERLPILLETLRSPGCKDITHVILEYDFKRRGLRMDCLLLAEGAIFVIEFKRSQFHRSDRDQVMNYAVNLLEFHRVTQDWCNDNGAILVPILALTEGAVSQPAIWPGLAGHNWPAMASKPLECDKSNLHVAIEASLHHRRSSTPMAVDKWLGSTFRPSSSILDATISLYGNHDVTAIKEHATSKAAIDAATKEIRRHIDWALKRNKYHIIFLSGAPGSGKTLVGLDIVLRNRNYDSSVFVTGNAPLVEVLNKALNKSYAKRSNLIATGYCRKDARYVLGATDFKIVKAHNFLGDRQKDHKQEDGRVLVFDEAQRTYEKGRMVLESKLPDHEADLILSMQRKVYSKGGAVVVALVGHNQAINKGERGIVAWLEAAERNGWSFSISDKTLELGEIKNKAKWASHKRRKKIQNGHLHKSMRYYRNEKIEKWGDAVLKGNTQSAWKLAKQLASNHNAIWITRGLDTARKWARRHAVGGQRSGIIASGQARRLAAAGLFVDHKPDIATWMLAPTNDIRSSNALETVQNQYQVQGLELDYCIVCWDADLRREEGQWAAYKLSGSDWGKDGLIDVAKNGYRVLLTRARKGMVIYIPVGDITGVDITRNESFYKQVYDYLIECGGQELIGDE